MIIDLLRYDNFVVSFTESCPQRILCVKIHVCRRIKDLLVGVGFLYASALLIHQASSDVVEGLGIRLAMSLYPRGMDEYICGHMLHFQ